jgi:hypothetical protein
MTRFEKVVLVLNAFAGCLAGSFAVSQVSSV